MAAAAFGGILGVCRQDVHHRLAALGSDQLSAMDRALKNSHGTRVPLREFGGHRPSGDREVRQRALDQVCQLHRASDALG